LRLRVVVVGIPGVGKTTVVGKLVSKVKGAKLVTFGSVMLEEAKRRKWIGHRDELRKLTVERQKLLQSITARKISSIKEGTVLVDTHLFVRTPEGFWPGLPFEVVRALKPTHLVLVEASEAEVSARRAADRQRYRDTVAQEELAEEMELARSFLTVSSTLTGAPMLIVANNDGRADEAASRIASVVRKAAS
jgi:adenylate kinase